MVGYSDTRSTFGVDAAFENQGQRSNAPGDVAFGVANVVFQRALTVRDVSLRQELAWTLGAHVVETGAEAHHLSTGLRFEIDGDRNQNAANGSSQQGGAGLPDLLDSSQQLHPRRARGCRTAGSSARARCWRPGSASTTPASPATCSPRRASPAR